MSFLAKKNIKLALLAYGIISLFVLLSPLTTLAQANSAPALTPEEIQATEEADAAQAAIGGVVTQGASADLGTDGLPGIGERLGLTGFKLIIFNIFSSLGALVAWLGGSLLDASIGVFTVGMYETSKYFKLDQTVETMWGIVRDIFNLLFIFGLIYAGFKLILGTDDSGSKQMISSIVVAALLINFSLYAAQLVVDFSNVIAYQVNQLIKPPDSTVVMGGWSVPNISTSFTQLTNLDKLGDQSQELATKAGLGVDTIGAAIILGLLFTVFYSVLGFVFAAGAFILFSRFIALTFLMIFSPVMFLGYIFPDFKSYSSQWGKLFMSQALVGPAFLFMLYISLQALSGLASIPPSEFTVMNLIIYLIIVAAFLWGSLMVAKSMSSWGALQAYNAGDFANRKLRRLAGGASAGATARLLRSTVGKRAQKYAESDKAKDRAANSWLGRRVLNISTKLGDSSFDARKIRGVGAKFGLGEGIKGYATNTKEIIEREKKYAERLGTVGDDDARVSAAQLEADATERSIEAMKESIAERYKEITTLEAEKAKQSEKDQKKTQLLIEQKRAEIAQSRGQIETSKEDLTKQKEDVQREKYRRQLGSNSNTPLIANQVRLAKGELKDLMTKYAEARDEKKAAEASNNQTKVQAAESKLVVIASEIATKKKELATAEEAARKTDRGYASTVENLGWVKNIFLGRDSKTNNEAGKEVRKEYKNKAKAKD